MGDGTLYRRDGLRKDGTLVEMVYGRMVHQERWIKWEMANQECWFLRWYIKRYDLWEILFMGDGTLVDLVYGRWYIRKYGLREMVQQEIWYMEMAHQERWFMRWFIRRDG